ncbi:hypothetical protein K493DRAFT_336799 [Basidiobolus meristosporus CBS 931.73]|uniref:Uncharacterized protein n=1 Tax=Basidiobolus meristosporus CBS 931.73 TaxID=1314790 RepID=A0A1Y1YFT0_9FUNG|nr:hypothetical protein K493DRAFT_336799 [Basidiobolus meristosporus CBS 931.73]|eukprot:ORX96743.1 hypothetical protein K493DRAFT_336799 [Basidiobolus meristosporus CBS 931.73]
MHAGADKNCNNDEACKCTVQKAKLDLLPSMFRRQSMISKRADKAKEDATVQLAKHFDSSSSTTASKTEESQATDSSDDKSKPTESSDDKTKPTESSDDKSKTDDDKSKTESSDDKATSTSGSEKPTSTESKDKEHSGVSYVYPGFIIAGLTVFASGLNL